jgi:hypothetical protein
MMAKDRDEHADDLEPADAATDGDGDGDGSQGAASDAETSEDRLLDQVKSLPRVESISISMRPTQVKPKKEAPAIKANVGLELKPFVPRAKKRMVTMSDMSMSGRPRGGEGGARRKR